jgi:hypothetical protein
MRRHRTLALGFAALAAVAAACNTSGSATTAPTTAGSTTGPAITAAPPVASIANPGAAFAVFQPKAGSSQSVQGGATLVGANGKTEVVIAVVSSSMETMAASIQAGTCDSLNPEIAYKLTDVVAGASATTVDVDVSKLLASPYAINITVAGSETESSITCGAIQAGTAP